MIRRTPHTIRYLVTSPDGSDHWEITNDVLRPEDFSLLDQINTGGGELSFELGRVLGQRYLQTLGILLESGGNLLSENDNSLLGEVGTTIETGDGTDLAVNNYLFVEETYGYTAGLLLENGDALLQENDDELLYEYGALDGRRLFSGYISKVTPRRKPGSNGISVTALPFSTDLEDTIVDVLTYDLIQNPGGTTVDQALYGPHTDPTRLQAVGQIFQATATGPVKEVYIQLGWFNATTFPTVNVIASLYSGSDPNSVTRSLIETVTVTVETRYVDGIVWAMPVFFSDDSIVTNGQSYHIEITTDAPFIAGVAPLIFRRTTTSTYAGGSIYTKSGGSSSYDIGTTDLMFSIFVATDNATTYTYPYIDPGFFLYAKMRDHIGNGNRLGLTYPSVLQTSAIRNTGTIAPEIRLNVSTLRELLDMVVRASPAGWFWRYNNADRRIYFNDSAGTTLRTFVQGIHLASAEVSEDMEDIVNKIYFTGGELTPGDPDTTLFKVYSDQASIRKYGLKATRITDLRVTNEGHADLIANYELESKRDPIYAAEFDVLSEAYEIGLIDIGDRVVLTNTGDRLDGIVTVVTAKTRYRNKVHLTCGNRIKTERRKLDEMRRAITALEVKTNPVSPS